MCRPRGWLSVPAELQVRVTGSYNSALEPLTTRTRPLLSRVAVRFVRVVDMLRVAVHVFDPAAPVSDRCRLADADATNARTATAATTNAVVSAYLVLDTRPSFSARMSGS